MKKVLSVIALTGMLVAPAVALAACSDYTTQGQPACEGAGCMWNLNTSQCIGTDITGPEGLIDLLETIGNWIFAALMVVVVIFLIVAGFMFVTAGGNTERVNSARQMVINALIGLAIAIGAKGLISIVTGLIT